MLRRRVVHLAATLFKGPQVDRLVAPGLGSAAVAQQGARAAAEGAALMRQVRHLWGRPRQEYMTFQRAGKGYGGSGRGRSGLPKSQERLLVFIGAGGALIWVTNRQEIPYTGRKHFILVDTETERQLGDQTFRQVLAEAQARRTLLPPNHPATRAVHRVGSRIAAVAGDGVGGGYQQQLQNIKWEFAVIRSPEVNAFVVPGGKVVVYTGLLNMIAAEDELAAVLAHEVAHIVARHAAERITQGSVVELLRAVAYWGFGLPIPSGPLTAVFFLPNSRKAETEADMIGVQLAARACYDPAAAVSVFAKLGAAEKEMGGDSMPKFLRTHPVSEDRITAIQQMLPRAVQLGEAAGCGLSTDLLHQFEGMIGRNLTRPTEWGDPRSNSERPVAIE